MTVSTETVRMAKSRPRKDQSECSDLPCHIIISNNCYHSFKQTCPNIGAYKLRRGELGGDSHLRFIQAKSVNVKSF